MSDDLAGIVQENQAQEHIAEPSSQATQASKNDEDRLQDLKLGEELDDAKHSKDNTTLLNKRYSELIHFFFNGLVFYIVLFVLFALFIASDKEIMRAFVKPPQWLDFIAVLAKKLLYIVGVLFLALLSFPTAKGLRRLFKSIVGLIAKKNSK